MGLTATGVMIWVTAAFIIIIFASSIMVADLIPCKYLFHFQSSSRWFEYCLFYQRYQRYDPWPFFFEDLFPFDCFIWISISQNWVSKEKNYSVILLHVSTAKYSHSSSVSFAILQEIRENLFLIEVGNRVKCWVHCFI